MSIKRIELDAWIRKLEDRGISEFEFRDLPDDLKIMGGLQKAKDLGLLKSIKKTNGRHTWKIVPNNISRNIYKISGKKEEKECIISK
jgi:hypothetical protein